MKRFTVAVLATASLCIAVAGTASAQSNARLHVGAGLVLPMSDWGSTNGLDDKTGFTAGLGASFGVGTAPIRLRVEGSWAQTKHQTGFDGNTRQIGGMVSVVYPFQVAGNIKPYILGGVGVTSTRVSDGTADTSKTGVGFGGGAGLQFAMSAANLFVEGRYLSAKGPLDFTYASLPITVGVSFPLGGKK